MANITLKIDDQTLEKARILAANRKTSINAIIRNKIEEFISSEISREANLIALDAFFARSKARIGNKSWTRENLYYR